jgi:hypothetical protein
MITRGFTTNTIVTRGFGGIGIVVEIWKSIVNFTVYIKRVLNSDIPL